MTAAAVGMGTYSAWESSTATLRLLGGAPGAWAPTGGGEGRGHIVSPRAQLVNKSQSLHFLLPQKRDTWLAVYGRLQLIQYSVRERFDSKTHSFLIACS